MRWRHLIWKTLWPKVCLWITFVPICSEILNMHSAHIHQLFLYDMQHRSYYGTWLRLKISTEFVAYIWLVLLPSQYCSLHIGYSLVLKKLSFYLSHWTMLKPVMSNDIYLWVLNISSQRNSIHHIWIQYPGGYTHLKKSEWIWKYKHKIDLQCTFNWNYCIVKYKSTKCYYLLQ